MGKRAGEKKQNKNTTLTDNVYRFIECKS